MTLSDATLYFDPILAVRRLSLASCEGESSPGLRCMMALEAYGRHTEHAQGFAIRHGQCEPRTTFTLENAKRLRALRRNGCFSSPKTLTPCAQTKTFFNG